VSALSDSGECSSPSEPRPHLRRHRGAGLKILSILPRPLTARYPSCSDQGYSNCRPDEYREAQGTSCRAAGDCRGLSSCSASGRRSGRSRLRRSSSPRPPT
jgi:hypothetical protein